MLDNNPETTDIVAGGSELYQLHRNGRIFESTGQACTGNSCPGWRMLDNNPHTRSLSAAAGVLYQRHNDGAIVAATAVPVRATVVAAGSDWTTTAARLRSKRRIRARGLVAAAAVNAMTMSAVTITCDNGDHVDPASVTPARSGNESDAGHLGRSSRPLTYRRCSGGGRESRRPHGRASERLRRSSCTRWSRCRPAHAPERRRSSAPYCVRIPGDPWQRPHRFAQPSAVPGVTLVTAATGDLDVEPPR